jgi:hypothetical protein
LSVGAELGALGQVLPDQAVGVFVAAPPRLAVQDGAGFPLVMSLWFLYEDGALWCATNAKARVIGYLTRQPRCGFEVAGDTPPL